MEVGNWSLISTMISSKVKYLCVITPQLLQLVLMFLVIQIVTEMIFVIHWIMIPNTLDAKY